VVWRQPQSNGCALVVLVAAPLLGGGAGAAVPLGLAWVSYMVKGYGDRQVSPLSPLASVFRLYSSTLYYDVGGLEMPTDDPNPGVRRYRQRVGNHNVHCVRLAGAGSWC
jgi:hypothetical protein